MGSQSGGRRPTIRTVAEHAGVSKSLVSLVLRDAPGVSEERREAVLAAMRELDYRPNASARALTEDRSHVIGVLVDDLRNPWYVQALEGINASLHRHDLRMLLGDQRLDLLSDEALTTTFLEMNVDGMILTGSLVPSERVVETAAKVPTVVVGSRSLTLPHVDVVVNDDELGARIAVRHLVDLGHRRIAHITAPSAVGQFRWASYRATMVEAGLEPVVVDEEPTEDGGYRAAVRLLTGASRPTAVFAYNDRAAMGVLSAAQQLGLDVPGDLSVVGYDDSLLAALKTISLTSVGNASYRVGYRAADLLAQRIADPARVPQTLLVEPSLAVRRTSGAAPLG